MKLKQIKNHKELPAAFSLEKYQLAHTFDICEWVMNLERRVLTIHMQTVNNGKCAKATAKRCDATLDKPIREIESYIDFATSPGLGKFVFASSVQDFSVMDFYWHGWECSEVESHKSYMVGFREYAERYALCDEESKVNPLII